MTGQPGCDTGALPHCQPCRPNPVHHVRGDGVARRLESEVSVRVGTGKLTQPVPGERLLQRSTQHGGCATDDYSGWTPANVR